MTVDYDDLQQLLQVALHRLATELDVPGVSVALAFRSQVVEATFGVINTRTNVAVTPDSLFQIQSITKIFTATLVMQLVDAGLVELDQPVRTYLPEGSAARVGDRRGQAACAWLMVMIVSYSIGVNRPSRGWRRRRW